MSRPGFALDVDERTQPLLVPYGTGVRLERFGLGTRVLYPGDGDPARSPLDLVDAALAAPGTGEPLAALLRPGMRLTITFSDASVPTPSWRHDARRLVIERIVEAAAAARVDDVAFVAATGLRRQLTPAELTRLLGERVMRSFDPSGLVRSHDAEDAANLVEVAAGVQVNRRVAESDLVVHVDVLAEHRHGGWTGFVDGLGGTATVNAVSGLSGQDDPGGVATIVAAAQRAVPVFGVELVLGQPMLSKALAFVSKREWEWTLRDRASYVAVRRALAVAPRQSAQALLTALQADYEVLGVHTGDLVAAHEAASAQLLDAQRVVIDQPTDVLVAGIGQPSAQAPGSAGNPLIAAWEGLARLFGATTGAPLVREGGALVLFHPLSPRFSTRHHSASADFFAEVLPETTDALDIAAEYEPAYAADPWYLELYRHHNAFHPLHPFHLWYAMAPAVAHLADVVWVGADRPTAARMGFRAASTYADALEVLASSQGRQPAVTYLHNTGQVVADMAAQA